MNWLYYLLEANFYLLIFYAFYRLFLHDETFYSANRYFLLLSSLIAFALPLMQIGLLKPAPLVEMINYQIVDADSLNQLAAQPIAPEPFDFTLLLYPIYLIIAAGFAIKLAMSVAKIIKMWISADKQRSGTIVLVKLNNNAAFSFFNLLFIHPHLADKKAVVAHEMVHIKQKHSFDILLFEILQILCWFNPIIHFIKKDIKLLHEYIADELSTNADMQKHEYAMFLIENSFGVAQTALTNQFFNQSILKRRINMLNKKRTAGRARLRLLLAIPLTAAMLCASTMAFTKDYGYIDLLPEKSTSLTIFQNTPQGVETKQETPKAKTVSIKKVPGKSIRSTSGKDIFFNQKTDANGETVSAEKRLIVINNEPVKDGRHLFGVKNAKTINFLPAAVATKTYGDKAKFGAIIIIGDQLSFINKPIPNVKATSKNNVTIVDSQTTTAGIRTVSIRRPDSLNSTRLTGVRVTNLKREVRDSLRSVSIRSRNENRNENNSQRINLKTDSVKGIRLRLKKTEPLHGKLTGVTINSVPSKVTGTQVKKSPEIIEVQLTNSQNPKLKEVVILQPTRGTSAVKEVEIVPVKGINVKPKEVIEIKLTEKVKGTQVPVKGNN
jgi:hypothetical protein